MNYREPVIGTRDLVSPHGQFTAELYDADTGKVAHRVVVENTILDCSLRIADQRIRNVWNTGSIVGTDTDQWWMQTATTPKESAALFGIENQQRWLYLSDSSVAVNAQEWAIPGNMIGGVWTPEGGGYGVVRRGSNTLPQHTRERTKRRFSVDFSAGQALGTIASFGMGTLIYNSSLDAMWPMPAFVPSGRGTFLNAAGAGYNNSNTNYNENALSYIEGFSWTGQPVNLSAKFVADNSAEFWYALGGLGIFNRNLALSAARPQAQAVTITGPTYTTIGATNVQPIGLTLLSGSMWLSYGLTLKKCAIPTDGTLSVTSTYATVSGFTDAAILDVTDDGTSLYLLGSTKVFVVDPATGAVTSSWAHGQTNVKNVEYIAAPVPYLYVTSLPTISSSTQSYYGYTAATVGPRIQSFTTAGVVGPYLFGLQNNDNYGALTTYAFTGTFGGGWGAISSSLRNNGFGQFRAPQGTSRAVLGSPFVKDATKSLRVVYDIGFT